MKFAVSSLLTLALASLAMAAPQEQALEKRQFPTDAAAISSLLANPSAALASATALLANPTIASEFKALVTASAFEAEVSQAYYSEFGSVTGSYALESYSAVISSLLKNAASATGSAKSSAAESGSSVASEVSSIASAQSSSGSSSSSGHNGASSGLVTLSVMGSAVVAGAAFVVAAL